MAANLNDPTTWDLSEAEMLTIATTGAVEEEEPKAEPEAPPVSEVPKEPEVVEAPSGPAPVVLAADQTHTIPYSVLQAARDEARQAAATAARLQQELDALKAQPEPAKTAELPETIKAHIATLRDNWGEDIAQQAERMYWLEQHTAQQQKTIDELNQYVQSQAQQQQQREEDQITDAIAASDKLNLWATATDKTWFDRAVELHHVLLKTDANYERLSWTDRMAKLPSRVEALYGASLVPVESGAVKQQVAAALDTPPLSLSSISGGALPEQTDVKKLEALEGNQLTDYMNKLATDPKKFEAFMRSFS